MSEPTEPILDHRSAFPDFYDNPTITDLAHESRWTISDSDKVPIDIRGLQAFGRLRGAYAPTDECLVPLDELMAFIPNAANNAFRVDAQVDGVAILDIEKTCPPELKEALNRMPALYRERSMSGHGLHLVMPLPKNFHTYPDAVGKRVLKGPNGWYEVLLGHYVTFTRDVIPEPVDIHADYSSWEQLWQRLASAAKPSPTLADLEVLLDRPDIVRSEEIIDYAILMSKKKTIEDFDQDASRFEFSVLSSLYHFIDWRTRPLSLLGKGYGETELVWMLYDAARRVLPYRDKHDQMRNGVPYLFDQALRKVAMALGEEAQGGSR